MVEDDEKGRGEGGKLSTEIGREKGAPEVKNMRGPCSTGTVRRQFVQLK